MSTLVLDQEAHKSWPVMSFIYHHSSHDYNVTLVIDRSKNFSFKLTDLPRRQPRSRTILHCNSVDLCERHQRKITSVQLFTFRLVTKSPDQNKADSESQIASGKMSTRNVYFLGVKEHYDKVHLSNSFLGIHECDPIPPLMWGRNINVLIAITKNTGDTVCGCISIFFFLRNFQLPDITLDKVSVVQYFASLEVIYFFEKLQFQKIYFNNFYSLATAL